MGQDVRPRPCLLRLFRPRGEDVGQSRRLPHVLRRDSLGAETDGCRCYAASASGGNCERCEVTPTRPAMPYDVTMAQRGSTIEFATSADDKVAEQLNRILASKAFRQADRLKRFLSFIVEETIAGRGERLKEFVVGVEVFGKDETFDPRNDPIVRVQARRLRAQLARYYREEGAGDDLAIELPKGGYAPLFPALKGAPPQRSATPALVSRNTVLVLPYSDFSEAGNQEYFCHGIVQEMIHELANMEAIRLVAWTGGSGADATDIREIGDRFNAATIISGSVRTS